MTITSLNLPHATSIVEESKPRAINQDQRETVEKLLDYYSTLAKDNSSWMETVTPTLPELIIKFPKLAYRPNNVLDEIHSFDVEFNLFNNHRQPENEKLLNDISKYRKMNMKCFQVPLPGLMKSGLTSTRKERIWNLSIGVILTSDTRKESPYCQKHGLQCESHVIYYSLAGLLLWIAFFFQMRFLPGFAITMQLVLLRFAPVINILPESSTFNGSFITENPNNGTIQILENNTHLRNKEMFTTRCQSKNGKNLRKTMKNNRDDSYEETTEKILRTTEERFKTTEKKA
ncbi:2729_t:CDS:2 [Ambispora gerdemannii]|uniref:2729_t:CDS:1 n=1 Tax=Ambispora gerdemannii TaxID=144530 RepID=A0A9N8VAD2_9GLOM|nr:2729_t:CDS:2 [Ambispora gerdemannii]